MLAPSGGRQSSETKKDDTRKKGQQDTQAVVEPRRAKGRGAALVSVHWKGEHSVTKSERVCVEFANVHLIRGCEILSGT